MLNVLTAGSSLNLGLGPAVELNIKLRSGESKEPRNNEPGILSKYEKGGEVVLL